MVKGGLILARRSEIVEIARSWLNVPWRHQGRTRLGVDCVGLITIPAKTLGLSDYDFFDYERIPGQDPEKFLVHFRKTCRQIFPVTAAREGDILIFTDRRFPVHAGIKASLEGFPSVIHATMAYYRVRETRFTSDWEKALQYAFAYPNLED